MEKVIKIFLGSSIVEFERERQDIENFLYRISRDFEKRYNVSIEPLLCENFDDAYTKIRKQEEYNKIVRESDMCVFIFFTKVGEYTHEEFEVARKKFEETGKPKIYTYFKTVNDGTVEQSVQDFMTELDSAFQHYYGNFEHIDTVKLRILLNLKLQELEAAEIKVDSDNCVVDGKKVLSLKNVSEFANNRILQEFTEELKEVEEKYFTLKAKYETEAYTSNEEREYIEIATKRQTLLDAIEELRKNIFNMSLRMCKDEIRGEITLRQKEAYRLFEMGDLEGANSILDFSEIKNEYMRRKAIREAEQKKDAQIFIRESRTKIEVLTAMTNLPTRFDEIEEIYDEITEIAFEENVELDVVFDFAEFLYKQNKDPKAYEISKRYESYLVDGDDEQKGETYYLLGQICNNLTSKMGETEDYCIKAVNLYEQLANDNPEKFNYNLAVSYNGTGVFYHEQKQCEKAKEYYENAIIILESLVKQIPEKYQPYLSKLYNNMGIFCKEQKNLKEAKEYYEKAIVIRESLVKEVSESFNTDLAKSYNCIGALYKEQKNFEEAKDYYDKAIAIRENLAKENPERFNPELAESFNSMGAYFYSQKEYETAKHYYDKALSIREGLANRNPEKFKPALASSLNNIGIFYDEQNQPEEAEKYYKRAITIRESLAKENARRFNDALASSYNNIGVFYEEQKQHDKAVEYYGKVIELYETFAKENPENYNSLLVTLYNKLSGIYRILGKSKEEMDYFEKFMFALDNM